MPKPMLPTSCPSCSHLLKVRGLECPACQTVVQGHFGLSLLSRLLPEEQEFVLHFLRASGSLKDLAKQYGVSYPTVRNRLDALIGRIETLGTQQNAEESEGPDHGR